MTKNEALRLALEALESTGENNGYNGITQYFDETMVDQAITAIKATLANEALERKAENARELGLDYEPYGFEASMYSNDRMKVDVVTGNVSIGTVKKPCGLECDCTDVCKQDDYKALWQQMCERCDELDKKLAHLEAKDEPVAWMFQHEETGRTMCVDAQQLEWGFEKGNPRLKKIAPLYTTPPQRTWVGLTDEEIKSQWSVFWEADCHSWAIDFARAIEAAHGIKGEA
jgi:hypothetical protein